MGVNWLPNRCSLDMLLSLGQTRSVSEALWWQGLPLGACALTTTCFSNKICTFNILSGKCLTLPGANPLVAERAPWRSSHSCVTRGQQPLEIPTDSCHFLCTLGNPCATPIVTRGEGSFSYQGVSTSRVRHSPVYCMAFPKENSVFGRFSSLPPIHTPSKTQLLFLGDAPEQFKSRYV